MNERQVTVDNETYALPRPFWVIATQNPAEHHGTYPLPESQLDRFLLRIRMGYPAAEDARAILRGEAGSGRLATMEPLLTMADVLELQRETQAVAVTDAVLDYELALVEATRHHPGLELGVSPRGLLMLHRAAQAWAMLEGRRYCIPGDVKRLLATVCAHRVITHAQRGERLADHAEQILGEIAATIPVPE
jgi:MoxR-like ATPase